jgi:hypothetical protein
MIRSDTEHLDIELAEGFRIKANYAGKETIYEVGASQFVCKYFFTSDGILSEVIFLMVTTPSTLLCFLLLRKR